MDIPFTTAILTYPVSDPTRSTGAATPTTPCWLASISCSGWRLPELLSLRST